uniref:Uncharacterized protein n=1 Tax=Aegilops tauschii subsp. strangulata TaxID=200361 RepID=A0A453RET2_AEGTS
MDSCFETDSGEVQDIYHENRRCSCAFIAILWCAPLHVRKLILIISSYF